MKESEQLYIISILFFVIGIYFFINAIKKITKKNKIELIDCFRLMYSFTYGAVPAYTFMREASGERNLYYFDYSPGGITNLFLLLFFSVFTYILLNFIYDKNRNISLKTNLEYKYYGVTQSGGKLVLLAGCISLAIGWASLFLWTKAYGSLNNFILEAVKIRSGRTDVANSLGFMKQFARVLLVSLYAIFSAYISMKPRGLKKAAYLLLLVLAGLGTFYFLLASDSRIVLAYTGLAIVVIILRHRKREKIGGYLILVFSILFAILVVTHISNSIISYFRYGTWRSIDGDFISGVFHEFSFNAAAQMKVLGLMGTDQLNLKFFDDFVNAITNWLPSRFVPFDIPENIWSYNTSLIKGQRIGGTLPTDFISCGIYEFGVPGIIIHPIMWGYIIAILDNYLDRNINSLHMDVYFAGFAGFIILQVSHNQFSSFVSSCFSLALYWAVAQFVGRMKKNHTA